MAYLFVIIFMILFGYRTYQDNDWLPHLEYWQSVGLVFGVVVITALLEILNNIASNINKVAEAVKENKNNEF